MESVTNCISKSDSKTRAIAASAVRPKRSMILMFSVEEGYRTDLMNIIKMKYLHLDITLASLHQHQH